MNVTILKMAEENAWHLIKNHAMFWAFIIVITLMFAIVKKTTNKNKEHAKKQKSKRNGKVDKEQETNALVRDLTIILGSIAGIYLLITSTIIPIVDCVNENYIIVENGTYTCKENNRHTGLIGRTVYLYQDGKKMNLRAFGTADDSFPAGEHTATIIYLKNSKWIVYVNVDK